MRGSLAASVEFAARVAEVCPHNAPVSSPAPTDGLNLAYNRINASGFEYDNAGNQTRVVKTGGVVQRFQYDAANRLVKVTDDNKAQLQAFTYGASNQRFMAQHGAANSDTRTYYAWSNGVTMAEYIETPAQPNTPQWAQSNIYLGGRLLATIAPNGGSEAVTYHHPDRLRTRLTTNAGTMSVQEQNALPYGSALDGESTGATARRFTTYERSAATGLDYAVNHTC